MTRSTRNLAPMMLPTATEDGRAAVFEALKTGYKACGHTSHRPLKQSKPQAGRLSRAFDAPSAAPTPRRRPCLLGAGPSAPPAMLDRVTRRGPSAPPAMLGGLRSLDRARQEQSRTPRSASFDISRGASDPAKRESSRKIILAPCCIAGMAGAHGEGRSRARGGTGAELGTRLRRSARTQR